MEGKLIEIEEQIKNLKTALDEALQLTREQMILIERQKGIINSLSDINKREEDIVKVLNYLVWKVNCMDSYNFKTGVMSNMFADMILGGGL